MKIERLPSGSYRVRKMYKGKNYSLTFDYKPTQKEVIQAMSDKLEEVKIDTPVVKFEDAARKYIEAKEAVLSPSTIRSYDSILRHLSDAFRGSRLSEITQEEVQIEISKYSLKRSAKSVKNAHAFVSAVLSMYRPNLVLKTSLPKNTEIDYYIPTPEEVRKVLELAKGTRYEIPFLLGAYGLRRSEICALTLEDLKGNILSVNKALVLNKDGQFVVKNPKTPKSTRELYISDYLRDLILANGRIYDGYPNKLLRNLHKMQDEAAVPRFRFHDFRHFFVTELSQSHFSEEDIMHLGGYSTPAVMKRVYRHARIDKDLEAKKRASETIANLIS